MRQKSPIRWTRIIDRSGQSGYRPSLTRIPESIIKVSRWSNQGKMQDPVGQGCNHTIDINSWNQVVILMHSEACFLHDTAKIKTIVRVGQGDSIFNHFRMGVNLLPCFI